jgi:hypothetical protein
LSSSGAACLRIAGHAADYLDRMDFPTIFAAVVADPRYQKNLDWGEPRSGHPEGTIRAHVQELEANLETLNAKLTDEEFWKAKLLIHVHDTFKPDSIPEIRITDPRGHASLARAFLAEFTSDAGLLAMVQFHDEPYALYRQSSSRRGPNKDRFKALLSTIEDWDVFLAFLICDGGTAGKPRDPLHWFFRQIEGRVESKIGAADVL